MARYFVVVVHFKIKILIELCIEQIRFCPFCKLTIVTQNVKSGCAVFPSESLRAEESQHILASLKE